MARQRLEIIINPDGSIAVEAHGYEGPACEKAVNEMLRALGAKQTSSRHKPEYARRPVAEKLRGGA
jgi:hypothetical protein